MVITPFAKAFEPGPRVKTVRHVLGPVALWSVVDMPWAVGDVFGIVADGYLPPLQVWLPPKRGAQGRAPQGRTTTLASSYDHMRKGVEAQMQGAILARGARTVVEVCAGVRPGEQVLVVTDPRMPEVAAAIVRAVYAAGAEPSLATIVPRTADGQEPPGPVAAAMAAADAFICPVSTSITHTRAVRDACARGSRGIMLTQFTPEMLVHGGIEADFSALAPVCRTVANALAGAEEITVRTPAGTDLTFSAAARRGNALTCVVGPGQFSPAPNVEANVSPVEGSANGIIVADASIPYLGIGLLREPVVLHVVDGMITSITGGEQAEVLQQDLASRADPNVYNIAELGIGLNPQCRFIGFMLEDEGVYGSVHVGIGTNITLGGTVKAACHYDLIMRGATVIADGRVILWDGQLALEPQG